MDNSTIEATIQVNIQVTGEIEGLEMGTDDAEAKLGDTYIKYPRWVSFWRVERIRSLKCFEVVREMLLSGIPPVEVARQVQILGEMTQISLDTVRVHMEHFRATLPKALMVARVNPAHYVASRKKVDATIDSIQVLSDLTEKMMKRIDIGMAREKAMNFLLPNMEKQFTVCMELACRIHEMKKNIGFNEQTLEVVDKAVAVSRVDWDKTYSKPGLNEVMSNPESRVRVIRFIEDMTGMFGKMSKEQQERILEGTRRASGKNESGKSGDLV